MSFRPQGEILFGVHPDLTGGNVVRGRFLAMLEMTNENEWPTRPKIP